MIKLPMFYHPYLVSKTATPMLCALVDPEPGSKESKQPKFQEFSVNIDGNPFFSCSCFIVPLLPLWALFINWNCGKWEKFQICSYFSMSYASYLGSVYFLSLVWSSWLSGWLKIEFYCMPSPKFLFHNPNKNIMPSFFVLYISGYQLIFFFRRMRWFLLLALLVAVSSAYSKSKYIIRGHYRWESFSRQNAMLLTGKCYSELETIIFHLL